MTERTDDLRTRETSRGFDAAAMPDLSALDAAPSGSDDIPRQLHRLADERVVHGLLRTLAASSRAALDRNVVHAIERLSSERAERPRGRQSPGRPLRRVHASWLKALARIAPALGLVLITIVLAQLANQTTPAADAAFQSVVKAATRAGPRRYALQIEHAGESAAPRMQRAIVDIAPGGRFLVRFGHVGRDPSNAFGFDGTNYWLVGPKGPVRISPTERLLARRGQLGEVTDLLVVDRLLKRLGTGYRITSETVAGDDELTRFTAVRAIEPVDAGGGASKPPRWRGRGPGPIEVVFEVRGTDRVVTRLDATWPPPSAQRAGSSHISRMHFALMGDQAPPPERGWFGHRMHHAADREVMEEAEPMKAVERPRDARGS